jgi:hypothetical protein
VIYYLVFEDAEEPGFKRRTAGKTVLAPQSSQKGLLDQVLSYLGILDSEESIAIECIAVLVYPSFRINSVISVHGTSDYQLVREVIQVDPTIYYIFKY